jgi:hypothetical protein
MIFTDTYCVDDLVYWSVELQMHSGVYKRAEYTAIDQLRRQMTKQIYWPVHKHRGRIIDAINQEIKR